MFAWCFEQLGGRSVSEARKAALDFYPFEPSDDPYRGLVFHDEAWHWAMIRIVGECYWQSRPELANPSEAYRAESARFELHAGR